MLSEKTRIQKFYSEKNIFITGGTGFLGKILVEKLLRSCDDIGKIYLLSREKKGKSPKERLDLITSSALFERVLRQNPRATEKIKLVNGDCEKANLGIEEDKRRELIDEIDVIFHCAATVRFDEKLKKATYINVRCVKDLMELASNMKNLKAFVHVSTAYSFSVYESIGEKFYEPLLKSNNLLSLVEIFPEEKLNALTPQIIEDWPNSYSFTKSVSEDIIKSYGKTLPLAMVRPSIILSTCLEPVPGWTDNIYGPIGCLYAGGLGLLHVLHCCKENVADIVPADYVVNSIIAAGWEISLHKNNEKTKICRIENVPIYNYVSRPEKSVTWEYFSSVIWDYSKYLYSTYQIWHAFMLLPKNEYLYKIYCFLFHTLPGHLADLVMITLGKKPMFVKTYEKINKFSGVLAYYSRNEWNFTNENTQRLWKMLDSADKKLFPFSMAKHQWDSYFLSFLTGGRSFLVHEPLDTVYEGKKKATKLRLAHYGIVMVILYLFFKFLMFFYEIFFG